MFVVVTLALEGVFAHRGYSGSVTVIDSIGKSWIRIVFSKYMIESEARANEISGQHKRKGDHKKVSDWLLKMMFTAGKSG